MGPTARLQLNAVGQLDSVGQLASGLDGSIWVGYFVRTYLSWMLGRDLVSQVLMRLVVGTEQS